MSKQLIGRCDCPVCDSSNTRVIATKEAKQGDLVVVRRRACIECGFRFWTGQPRETLVAEIKWSKHGSTNLVLEAFPEVD